MVPCRFVQAVKRGWSQEDLETKRRLLAPQMSVLNFLVAFPASIEVLLEELLTNAEIVASCCFGFPEDVKVPLLLIFSVLKLGGVENERANEFYLTRNKFLSEFAANHVIMPCPYLRC